MDRDYWHRERPFAPKKYEMSFMTKLVITLAILLICAVAYRYQSEITQLLQRPSAWTPPKQVVTAPRPEVITPPVAMPERPRVESSGQIYRCGNTYSSAPCENSRSIEVQNSRRPDMTATKEIYLCKDIYDQMTWESVPCSANGRFMDRIARVPANIPWGEQVAIARQQRDRAHAIAAEQVVQVAPRSTSSASKPGACGAYEERIRWLDAECRANSCDMRKLDWVRDERRKARDAQFRLGC